MTAMFRDRPPFPVSLEETGPTEKRQTTHHLKGLTATGKSTFNSPRNRPFYVYSPPGAQLERTGVVETELENADEKSKAKLELSVAECDEVIRPVLRTRSKQTPIHKAPVPSERLDEHSAPGRLLPQNITTLSPPFTTFDSSGIPLFFVKSNPTYPPVRSMSKPAPRMRPAPAKVPGIYKVDAVRVSRAVAHPAGPSLSTRMSQSL